MHARSPPARHFPSIAAGRLAVLWINAAAKQAEPQVE